MSRNTRALPFFKPYIRQAEFAAVRRIMRSGWLTTGSEAQAFEEEFRDALLREQAEKPGTLETLAVNSATSGLHLALEAVGIGPGDVVALPSMTFTATAEVVRYLGADPLFIDSEESSGNMDSADLRIRCRKFSSQGKKVKAVIPVHLAGYPCDISTIRDAVENDEVKIIEDAAHAFPSRHPAGIVGDIGDIGVFSFYATKTITTGEGGMIATRNPEYLERMRVMRLHGIDRTVWNRYGKNAGSRPWEYDVVAPGYKYNMTDLAAAIGRVQLHRADFLLGERRRLASLYNEALGDLKGVFLPEDRPGHAWHLYILRLERPEMRDALAESLGREGIGVSVHFRPLHRMTYWKNKYSMNPDDYPRAEKLADTILSLPLWPGMKDKNLRRVIRSVRRVVHG